MDGVLEAFVCIIAGMISLVVAGAVPLFSSDRRPKWRLLLLIFVIGLIFLVTGLTARNFGVEDAGIYWFSVPFFLLMFVSVGGFLGTVLGWLIRLGLDRLSQ